MEPLKPSDPEKLGGWTLTARLGEGASGVIFLGVRGVAGSQQAAIKLIRDEGFLDGNSIENLQNEVDALSVLEDPYIAKLVEWNLSGNELWIATEFINGPTLDTKLRQTKEPLTEIAWFQLAENLFHALRTIHSKGIIHRDIKPTNIILGESGTKLIDFGISHIPEKTRMALPGDFEGSILFSAPENFSRRNAPEMDVFSAAATLAYAGKLKTVWHGTEETQIAESMRKDEPNLDGLTELQKEFLNPLFEKLASDRPTSEEVHKKALEYVEYLLNVENKKKPSALKSRRGLLRRVFKTRISVFFASITAVVTLVSLSLILGVIPNSIFGSSTAGLLAQCKNNLQDRSPDLAVVSCTKAVESGSKDANLYLARAYKAKGSDSQAKIVLQNCKAIDINCESDFGYFFESGAKSRETLNAAYKKGNVDAAWRIGLDHQKRGETTTALQWYEKGHKSQSAPASIILATYYAGSGIKNYSKAINYAKAAVGGDITSNPKLLNIDHPVERLIQALYVQSNDLNGAISYFKKCAQANEVYCISVVAENYLELRNYKGAESWGRKGSEFNDGRSSWVVARVFVHQNSLNPSGKGDPAVEKEIAKWYKKSAEQGELKGMMALGLFYAFGTGGLPTDFKQSCIWYQKAMVVINDRKGTFRQMTEDANDYKSASQFFEAQYCQDLLLGDNPKLRFSSPTPTPKKQTQSQAPSEKVSPRSTSLSTSAPVSNSVITSSIFGKPWQPDPTIWNIPLTNSKGEAVPQITGVQFRLIGYPNAEWIGVPFQLKQSNGGAGIWAEVNALLFAVLFKDQISNPCPEFRFIQETGGEIVHIWNKSAPTCTY